MSAPSPSRSKRFRRRVLRPLRNGCVGVLGAPALRLWRRALRVRIAGHGRFGFDPQGRRRLLFDAPGIYAFWHQRLLGLSIASPVPDMKILISAHGDGEMIARTIERLGMKTLRGSTTRGGTRAILGALRQSRQQSIGITPDGPKGPSQVFHPGAIYLASRARMPIYPITFACGRFSQLRTWDRMLIPAPFTSSIICFGEVIRVPPDLDRDALEEHRAAAEQTLRELTRSTDEQFEELYRQAQPIAPAWVSSFEKHSSNGDGASGVTQPSCSEARPDGPAARVDRDDIDPTTG